MPDSERNTPTAQSIGNPTALHACCSCHANVAAAIASADNSRPERLDNAELTIAAGTNVGPAFAAAGAPAAPEAATAAPPPAVEPPVEPTGATAAPPGPAPIPVDGNIPGATLAPAPTPDAETGAAATECTPEAPAGAELAAAPADERGCAPATGAELAAGGGTADETGETAELPPENPRANAAPGFVKPELDALAAGFGPPVRPLPKLDAGFWPNPPFIIDDNGFAPPPPSPEPIPPPEDPPPEPAEGILVIGENELLGVVPPGMPVAAPVSAPDTGLPRSA
ncbi:hypothetical protein [Mycobacteroides abscessus]|uniref:hypothetical protein n=1 Tax=Mycobacteroides abscessus TaxID=36809 RepID=UPI0019D171F5|nr:hypothetical protein [Mycobacteroides abscessus]QSN49620.1 hypothetical protein I3U33_26450 [Mycobacteroides abscessus subsp. abscessus]